MSIVTYEGIVENGQIRLQGNVTLPEQARVYVLIPNAQDLIVPHIYSPRLVDPRDAARFEMEITEDQIDANI